MLDVIVEVGMKVRGIGWRGIQALRLIEKLDKKKSCLIRVPIFTLSPLSIVSLNALLT
jgi:hypothetical protein